MIVKKVYKYPLGPNVETDVDLPEGAEVLTVQMQGGQPCLWALVDPEEDEIKTRRFMIIGTGWPIDRWPGLQYIATVQQADGALIWHVFEEV